MRRGARTAALATFATVLLACALLIGLPYLTKKRDQPASVPDPSAISTVSLDVIPPGGKLCAGKVAVEQHSQVARLQVGTYGKPGPALSFAIDAPGYGARASQPGGFADNAVLSFHVAPPPRSTLATVCVRNRGKVKAALYAAGDDAHSRAIVTINGKSVWATPALAFYEAQPRTIAERLPLSVQRAATFRGPFSHAWIIWLVLALFLVGVPLGIGAALHRGWD